MQLQVAQVGSREFLGFREPQVFKVLKGLADSVELLVQLQVAQVGSQEFLGFKEPQVLKDLADLAVQPE